MNQSKTLSTRRLTAELLTGILLGLSLFGPACAQDNIAAIPGVTDAYTTDRLTPPTSDLANLLPLVLISRERRELAEKLEASIRRGDMNGAQDSLDSAIEVGTLAIVLAGQLKNPDLLATLQNLGIKGNAAFPADPSANCTVPVALTDLQEALERERNYSGVISQTLDVLMQENNALKARLETEKASQETQTSEIQQALQGEQEKRETSVHELTNLRNDYQTLQAADQAKGAAATNIAEWEARLHEVQEQRDRTAGQLADMEKELRALRALKEQEAVSQSAHVSELEKTLARAQAQGEILAQELIAVNKELSALKEPHQSSITPLVHRFELAGMDAPLPEAVEDTLRETPTLQQGDVIASPEPSLAAQGDAATQKQKEPAPVVIASLPASPDPIPTVSAPTNPPKSEDRLTSRADELLRKGDVSGARLLLERALNDSNPRAAFLMGETFDPNVLVKLRALGIRGDISKAREFYAQALTLGMVEARARMEALK